MAKKAVAKPKPTTKVYLDYGDVCEYLWANCDKKMKKLGFPKKTRFGSDFALCPGMWDYLLSEHDIHNGAMFTLSDPRVEKDQQMPDLVRKAIELIFDEFKEYAENGELEFHVWW